MNNSTSFLFSDDNTAALYQNQQNCGGLARFRSVPSSFLATLLDSVNESNNSSSVEESESILSNLMNQRGAMKQEIDVPMEQRNGSYSVGAENDRMDCGNHSNLARQTSSPAGFFNGFGVMGEVGNYRMSNCAEVNSRASDLTNQINYSFDTPPSSRFLPSIPGNRNERSLENVNGVNGREYAPTLLKDSWNDLPFNGMKRNRDDELKMYSNINGLMGNEDGKIANSATRLTHHLSLPKIPSQVASVENFLQFQEDAVPKQIRAKRGCATHPRSIAERMRRTRISERMKKLQDLCPNMDKQMNTAHMLDMAVEYIKDLQEQVQELTEKKAKCRCPSMERYANLIP